jgi:hypothetical protein
MIMDALILWHLSAERERGLDDAGELLHQHRGCPACRVLNAHSRGKPGQLDNRACARAGVWVGVRGW